MKRIIALGLALAMAALSPAVPSTALALDQDHDASLNGIQVAQTDYSRGDRQRDQDTWDNRDNSPGDWDNRGEPDNSRGGWRDRDNGTMNLEGRWVAERGQGSPWRSRWGHSYNANTLPKRLMIDQRRNVILVQDFRGNVIQQIVIKNQGRWGDQGRWDANRGGYVIGQWRDSKLETFQRTNHARIVQTFALVNRGRTLVVHTQQDGWGASRDMEFTSVYQRA